MLLNDKKEIKAVFPYVNDGKKTLRTNIDGFSTCKLDENINLVKNEIIEVQGQPEIYKVLEVTKCDKEYIPHDYYTKRKYDELVDVKILKLLDATNLRKEDIEALNLETGSKLSTKENYEINGVPVVIEGRLNKNQVVRVGSNVITITDLIKPEEKGGLIKVVGLELERVIVDSVHRVYKSKSDYEIVGEYSDWGDALLASLRYNTYGYGQSHL